MKKKSKQKLSDSKRLKPVAKKLNPFEVHINRKKYDILGMKSKSERGLPGVSRAKSLKKRKRTILQEYKLKEKKNIFLDRRIGENNKAMTAEDKILARYAAERMKFHSKKSMYNLGDDEELTHKGQTLTEIEKFDDPKSDDDYDEVEEDGKLNSNFVEEAHFGGGIFKKVEGESKSRKDLIDQLIAESIKRKAEKQKLRQQTLDLTQRLDSEWKELLPLVTASKKTKTDVEPEVNKDKFATYDIMSKKLKFETRGKPSDRLKSEEEIAKEEKEKLEKLEKERLQRMKGEIERKGVAHRSADDLDDGFYIDEDPETFLSYKNGVLNVEEKKTALSQNITKKMKKKNDSFDELEVKLNEKSDDDDDGDDNDEDNKSDDSGDDENSDESNNLSDLKDDDEDDQPYGKNKQETQSEKNEDLEKKNKEITPCQNEIAKKETEKEVIEKAKAMEAARNELPYTFDIPKEYNEFEKLMKTYNLDFQAVIVERMIKCHHPSLKENFKANLDLLYTFLLQHLQDCASDDSSMGTCFKVLDQLAPFLYDLAQWNPSCSSGLLEVIKEKYQDYLKAPKVYPSLDTLIFLKLVSILFPTSDYRHPVVTPSLIFMQQMQFQCRVRSSVDLSKGLFIATLLLEYTALSKKYVPEAITFLQGVFRLVHPRLSELPVFPPFEYKTEDSLNLVVTSKSSNIQPNKLSAKNMIQQDSSDEFKINATSLALNLLDRFCDFWSEDEPASFIFEPFIKLLDEIQYADSLKKDVQATLSKILKFKNKNLVMLMLEKRKPQALRLYEPNIERVYSLKKHRPMGKKKAERMKLLHKYKREMKGALREIRKDRSFIANLKYKDTIKSDMERQAKVREIFSSAAEQAGELNKIQRKKKK